MVVNRGRKGAVAERLERSLIPVSTFIVIPLFALANAGVPIDPGVFTSHEATLVGAGIAAGLIAGKALGIFGGALLVVKTRLGRLPEGVQWGQIFGVGLLSGVGFTLSIFIAELAFEEQQLIDAAKMSIFIASLVSAVAGILFIRFFCHNAADDSSLATNESSDSR
jgi:NhaA family Na+:H+ antiporter